MVLPEETGVLMTKDAKFFFQMHYTRERQGGARRQPHGPVLPQGRAEVPVPQRRDGEAELKIPREHQGAHRVGVADVRRTT